MSIDQSEWRSIRFGDVVRNVNENIKLRESETLPYVAGPHIDEGLLSIKRCGQTSDADFPPTFRRIFQAGDVLLHSRNINKIGVADFAGVTGEKLFVLRTMDSDLLSQEYIPWLMLSENLRNFCVKNFSGSVNKFLNWTPLASYQVRLPPLEEQRRIAGLLLGVEDVRDRNAVALRSAVDVEIATLREAYGVASWPVRKVSEAGEVQLGLMRSPKVHTGADPRPYLRVANVGDDKLFLNDVMSMNFDEKNFRKYQLRSGDILLNEGQSLELVGRCAIYRDEIPGCCFQKTLLRFRCGPDILPEFAYGWFRRCFHLGEFSRVASRTTSMAHLTARIFSDLPIPVPSLAVQRLVIERVEAARSVRRRLADHETASRQLRPQLLNYLLAE